MSKVSSRCCLAFTLMVLTSLLGCGKAKPETEPVATRILGNWEGKTQIDEEAFQKFLKSQNIPDEQAPEVKKFLEESTNYLAFQKDGKGREVRADSDDDSFFDDLTWEVLSETGNQARIKTEGAHSPGATMDITFEDDDTFSATPVPEEDDSDAFPFTFLFKRVKEIPQKPEGYGEK